MTKQNHITILQLGNNEVIESCTVFRFITTRKQQTAKGIYRLQYSETIIYTSDHCNIIIAADVQEIPLRT